MRNLSKRFICILLATIAVAGNVFSEVPAFTDSAVQVIDTTVVSGKLNDNVKLRNISSASNFSVTVNAWNAKENKWIELGTGKLKGFGDECTVRKNLSAGRLKNYEYFALTSTAGVQFRVEMVKNNNDLFLYLQDDVELDESHSFEIDATTVSGKFKDQVKIAGGATLRSAAAFKIYGYNSESERGNFCNLIIIKGAKDSDGEEFASGGVPFSSFRYIKVVALDGKDYRHSEKISSHDLVITVWESNNSAPPAQQNPIASTPQDSTPKTPENSAPKESTSSNAEAASESESKKSSNASVVPPNAVPKKFRAFVESSLN